MRKSYLFTMVLAGSCLGFTGCIGALGGLLPGLLGDVAFSAVGALLTSLISGAITPAAQ